MQARSTLVIAAFVSSAFFFDLGVLHAEVPRVGALAPTFTPPKAEEIVTRFQDAINEGLAKAKIPTLSTAKVRAKVGASCGAARCAKRAHGALGVPHVVYGRVDTAGKNYTIKLGLYPSNAKVKGRCDICTLMEALGTTKRLAAKLGRANRGAIVATAAAKKARAAAKSEPAPKKLAAPSPVTTPTPATRTEEPETEMTPATTRRKEWPLWPSLAAAGVGVIGLAAGLPLLSIDGDYTSCSGPPLPNGAHCEDRYSTSGGGWVLTAMGVAGLVTSGVLFYLYLDSRGEKSKAATTTSPWSSLSIAPTHDGFLVGAGGVF